MSYNWKQALISPATPLKDVLNVINSVAIRVAVVTGDKQELLGIVTDGDIRRGLLNGITLEHTAADVMNLNPVSASPEAGNEQLIELMESKGILAVPIVSNGQVTDIATLHHALSRPRYENPVFLMAGGFGKRLKPLTDERPKPMLVVGERPILETILLSFVNAGFVNFYISTHYMPELIKEHFGDGSQWGVNITYIEETSPLGTGGSLGLLPDNIPDLPIIMMNGDILTKVDFQRLLKFHNKNNADATMCVREYEYQIPYGVITGEGINITQMIEKPLQRFFINAGVYIVSQEIARSVPEDFSIDMPTLLEQNIEKDKNVIMFPIHEYWLDIGQMDDFKRAQTDIYTLELK